MTILIGGDTAPTESNHALFEAGNIQALFGDELLELFHSADVRIANLESPLCDCSSPINKCGPCLRGTPAAADAFRMIGLDAFALANNHIMDHGDQGLNATFAALDQAGVQRFGAGSTLEESAKPFIAKVGEKRKRIGFYSCAEHEFSIACQDSPGANPFDPLDSFDHVASLARQCDGVIVLYHGGTEYYRYPSPQLQRICRKFVEKGASLVLCQHSHCVGCEERYRQGVIVYGQGNFLMDRNKREEGKNALLVKIDETLKNITYIPVVKAGNGVRLAGHAEAEAILRAFEERSREIQEESFVARQYAAFAEKRLNNYLQALHGVPERLLTVKVLNLLTGGRFRQKALRCSYELNDLLAIQDFIACEAHRELLLTGLEQKQQACQ